MKLKAYGLTCLPISFTSLVAFFIEKWIESSSLTILLICSVWQYKRELVKLNLEDLANGFIGWWALWGGSNVCVGKLGRIVISYIVERGLSRKFLFIFFAFYFGGRCVFPGCWRKQKKKDCWNVLGDIKTI